MEESRGPETGTIVTLEQILEAAVRVIKEHRGAPQVLELFATHETIGYKEIYGRLYEDHWSLVLEVTGHLKRIKALREALVTTAIPTEVNRLIAAIDDLHQELQKAVDEAVTLIRKEIKK